MLALIDVLSQEVFGKEQRLNLLRIAGWICLKMFHQSDPAENQQVTQMTGGCSMGKRKHPLMMKFKGEPFPKKGGPLGSGVKMVYSMVPSRECQTVHSQHPDLVIP